MARKSEIVAVPTWEGNRDSAAGKQFLITEWPAERAEKWGWRMLILLKGSSGRIPDSVVSMGMVGVALVGLNTFLQADIDPDRLEPLLDQLFECVRIIRDPRFPDIATPIASPDDIEEVKTRLWLKSEVIRVHTNFSIVEALSKLLAAINSLPAPSSIM
jgi:hypothetical protein